MILKLHSSLARSRCLSSSTNTLKDPLFKNGNSCAAHIIGSDSSSSGSASILTLTFPASRTVRNECLVKPSTLWWFVIAASVGEDSRKGPQTLVRACDQTGLEPQSCWSTSWQGTLEPFIFIFPRLVSHLQRGCNKVKGWGLNEMMQAVLVRR